MCSYCGCRAITMIGRLSTEHVEIINATGALRRVALDGDGDATATAVEELAVLLDPHTTGEEQGLFAELRLNQEFAAHVDALCAEHREIDARLARVASGDHAEVDALENLLRRHIDKEENGIFPAAAVALDGAAWARIEARTLSASGIAVSPDLHLQPIREGHVMQTTSLTALVHQHLTIAREASSGRSSHTVYGGHEHTLRQTLIALASGQQLDEHESPGEATLHVLHGTVRLTADDSAWDGTAGDHLVIPPDRHGLEALVDSVVLLTVAIQG